MFVAVSSRRIVDGVGAVKEVVVFMVVVGSCRVLRPTVMFAKTIVVVIAASDTDICADGISVCG